MAGEQKLIALIDGIYEAVLDNGLWPSVLVKVADSLGVEQIAMASADRRAKIIETIAPRTDPKFCESFKRSWAFRDPVFAKAMLRPQDEIYTLDDLTKREAFASSPIFNELWRPAGWGLAAAGANLLAEDHFSALFCIANGPEGAELAKQQLRLFEGVARHLGRAVRMNRRLWKLDLANLAAEERFDLLPDAALLVDASSRVALANAAAQSLLDSRMGVFLSEGRLSAAGTPDLLQELIASCARRSTNRGAPGGELILPREFPKPPLRVLVTPLRSHMGLPEVPWAGFGSPVAIVSVTSGELDRERWQRELCGRFEFTVAEAALASEILQGDGRKAAAKRCGMSDQTAKTHLSNIFEKTGTHRQAELVRFLLSTARTADLER